MNRQTVLNTLFQYKQLREQFIGLCTAFAEVLPSGNDYGIEIGSGDEVSRSVSILGHPCKLVFGVRLNPEPVIGKITLQRLLAQEKTSYLLTVYFDRLGNATETPDETSWPYSIKGTDVTNWLVIRMLEEFFKSVATQSNP